MRVAIFALDATTLLGFDRDYEVARFLHLPGSTVDSQVFLEGVGFQLNVLRVSPPEECDETEDHVIYGWVYSYTIPFGMPGLTHRTVSTSRSYGLGWVHEVCFFFPGGFPKYILSYHYSSPIVI